MNRVTVFNWTGYYATGKSEAERVFNEIKRSLAEGEPITLDFSGVKNTCSSFLNYAIGQIYKEFDADGMIKIENASPAYYDLLYSVFANAKEFYAEEIKVRQNRRSQSVDIAFTLEEIVALDELLKEADYRGFCYGQGVASAHSRISEKLEGDRGSLPKEE